jgi:multicomponent Na+:H+ antiporter subunit G
MITSILILVLVVVGPALIAIAALGLLRMPDLYSRLHAASKAATLGMACIALALVLHFSDASVGFRAVALGLIVVITAPLSAHLIARAGFVSGTPLADEYVVDETRDRRR